MRKLKLPYLEISISVQPTLKYVEKEKHADIKIIAFKVTRLGSGESITRHNRFSIRAGKFDI